MGGWGVGLRREVRFLLSLLAPGWVYRPQSFFRMRWYVHVEGLCCLFSDLAVWWSIHVGDSNVHCEFVFLECV